MTDMKKRINFITSLGLVIFTLGLIGLVWLGLLAYNSYHTEIKIKALFVPILAKNGEKSDFISLELSNYNRSLLKSYAQFRVRSTESEIDSLFEDEALLVQINHGPIVITEQGIYFDLALITGVLKEANSLDLTMKVGFDNILDYTIKTTALNYQEGKFSFKSTEGMGSGVINLQEPSSAIILEVERIDFTLAQQSVVTVGNKLMFNFDNSFDAISIKEKSSSGLLQDLQPSMLVKEVMDYQKRYDIQQQIALTLEFSGDQQEGRDKLFSLYDKISQLSTKDAAHILSQCFDTAPRLKTALVKEIVPTGL